jgi:hypothetical protein
MSKIAEVSPAKRTKSAAKKSSRTIGGLSAARLKKIIARLMNTLEKDVDSSRGSVSELLKLLQLYQELTAQKVKEVEVRWVDRLPPDSESGQ